MAAKKKVIYFTAGDVPTSGEIADIAKLNDAAVAPYDVAVRSAIRPMESGGDYEAADYYAGTLPAGAAGTHYGAIDQLDPDAIPNQSTSATQAVVENGVGIVVPVTGSYTDTITPTIVDGVITGFVLS